MTYRDPLLQAWNSQLRCRTYCMPMFNPFYSPSLLKLRDAYCKHSCHLPWFNAIMANLAMALLLWLLIYVIKFSFRSIAPDVTCFRDYVVRAFIAIFLLFCSMAVLALSLPALEFILFEL